MKYDEKQKDISNSIYNSKQGSLDDITEDTPSITPKVRKRRDLTFELFKERYAEGKYSIDQIKSYCAAITRLTEEEKESKIAEIIAYKNNMIT